MDLKGWGVRGGWGIANWQEVKPVEEGRAPGLGAVAGWS